jgi:hypothetical protein
MSHVLRSIVAVSGDPHRADLLDALIADENGFDVIFVESIERGYSRIKQVFPDVVVVYSPIDDAAACQLLSMLHTDRAVSGIPVVTCTPRSRSVFEDIITDVSREASDQAIALPMN